MEEHLVEIIHTPKLPSPADRTSADTRVNNDLQILPVNFASLDLLHQAPR